MKIDATDYRIIEELQRDGSLSNVELARRVHLSPSPCLTRVKALEAAGVIARYVALVNAAAPSLEGPDRRCRSHWPYPRSFMRSTIQRNDSRSVALEIGCRSITVPSTATVAFDALGLVVR